MWIKLVITNNKEENDPYILTRTESKEFLFIILKYPQFLIECLLEWAYEDEIIIPDMLILQYLFKGAEGKIRMRNGRQKMQVLVDYIFSFVVRFQSDKGVAENTKVFVGFARDDSKQRETHV